MDCRTDNGEYRLDDRIDADDRRNLAVYQLRKQFDHELVYRARNRGGNQSEEKGDRLIEELLYC